MPKQRKKEMVVGQHYTWLLGKRGKVYVADGRSNQPPLGRHSLGTTDYSEAIAAVKQLDLVMAVQHGRAKPSILESAPSSGLELAAGWKLYCSYVARPKVTGGARATTSKRYRPVFNKFSVFARSRGITCWDQVDRRILEAYAAHLDDQDYAYATEYLELTTLKQTMKWLVDADYLPPSCRIRLPMAKPTGTDTYCWSKEQVEAMIQVCDANPELRWLGFVVTALSRSGLRISELASLRWTDINFETNVVLLTDESTRAPGRTKRKARELKNHRSRSFPIHSDLRTVLLLIPRNPDGLIFHGAKGARLKPDRVRRALIRDVLTPLKARFPTPPDEIGFEHGRLHSFRHYFCSTCANSGMAEQVAMKWLGHSNSKMVKHYYHLHDDEAQRLMQKLTFVSEVHETRSTG